MGVPYVPILGLAGTDLLRGREDMQLLPDPFNPGVKTVVAKALRPDAAVFHALKADRQGNVSFGYASDNVILAEASRTVIVTAEEIVDRLTEQEAVGGFIPGLLVDMVVHAPFGAHPGACRGRYEADAEHMAWYVRQCASDEAFAEYLRQTVFESPDHAAYVRAFVNAPGRGVPAQGPPAGAPQPRLTGARD